MQNKYGISLFIIALALSFLLYVLPHRNASSTSQDASQKNNSSGNREATKSIPEVAKSPAESLAGEEEVFTVNVPPDKVIEYRVAPEADSRFTSYGQGNNAPVFLKHKNVEPPLPGLLPGAYRVEANPTCQAKVNFPNGAVMDIPANTFVDENGNLLKEPVHISYRQFDNAMSVFLSGIPMTYDSAGKHILFQTAGMFDWNVTTASGKPVKMKDGSSVSLNMPTIDTADNFNFYEFNSSSGSWGFKNPASPSRSLNQILIDTIVINYPFDTTLLENTFENPAYHFLARAGEVSSVYNYTSRHAKDHEDCKRLRTAVVFFNKAKLLNLVATREPVTVDGKRSYLVSFQLKRKYMCRGVFPELAVFEGYKFYMPDIKKLSEFYKEFKHGRDYYDVRIQYEKGSDECLILLKHTGGITKLKGSLSRSKDGKSGMLQRARFERRFERYERLLRDKLDCHAADVRLKMNKERFKVVSRFFRQLAIPQYRTIVLAGFGLYNCDRAYLMENRMAVRNPVFADDAGKPVVISRYDVIDSKAKGVFSSYYPADLVFSHSNVTAIIAHGINDDIYYVSGAKLREMNWTKRNAFPLKELKKIPEDENALRELITQ